LNFGVAGYNAAHNALQMALDVPRFQPDVVVLFQGYNDLAALSEPDGSGRYAAVAPEPHPPKSWSLLVRRWRAWRQGRAQREHGNAAGIEAIRRDTMPTAAEASFADAVKSFVGSARAMGAEPVLATQVYPFAAEAGQNYTASDADLLGSALQYRPWLTPKGLRDGALRFNEVLRATSSATGARLVDSARKLPYDKAWFGDDIHFSDRGSAGMADLMAEELAPVVAAAARKAAQ
jgi:lysophospholipase L1-like esterase